VSRLVDRLRKAVGGKRWRPPSGASFLSGFCNVCGGQTRFFYTDPALYRESLVCEHCRTTSR
jgi:hypothetical protein